MTIVFSPWDSLNKNILQNIAEYVPQKKESYSDLKWHEGKV